MTITNGDFESNFEVLKKKIKKPLKVPSLARSVPKPLKVPSLARSAPKPLKMPSLARSVPKPLSIFVVCVCGVGWGGGGGGEKRRGGSRSAQAVFSPGASTPFQLVVRSEVRVPTPRS